MRLPPLVFKDGQLQQLQSGDDVVIPLEERVELLEAVVVALLAYGLLNGWELPALSDQDAEALLKEMTCF